MGIKSQIMTILRDSDEPMTISEIATALSRPKSTWLRQKLEQMRTAGMIERSKKASTGRPAIAYAWKNPDQLTVRQQWRRWCEENIAMDYIVWLEERVKKQ